MSVHLMHVGQEPGVRDAIVNPQLIEIEEIETNFNSGRTVLRSAHISLA
jgi:hypothetical protein